MQRIEVTINADGDTQVEAIGCAGPSCQNLTAAIEKAIGKTTADRMKPEFHNQQGHDTQQTAKQ